MAPTSHTPDQQLDRNGTTLAHVVEWLVIGEHYSTGHGPQLREPRPPMDRCDTQPCPTWRRYLAGRF